jgi:hypothetical protein
MPINGIFLGVGAVPGVEWLKWRIATAGLKLSKAAVKAFGESGVGNFSNSDNIVARNAARGINLEHFLCIGRGSWSDDEAFAGCGGESGIRGPKWRCRRHVR